MGLNNLRVIITGGNGFIGSHLSEELVNRNDSVSLLDLAFNSNTKGINCKKIFGNIRNYNSVKKAIDGADAIFHFAAISRVISGQKQPLNCWRTNVLGTVNVLEACRKARSKPVIFLASSREVYGEPQYLPVDESHPKNPKSIYGVGKLCAEKCCFSYHNLFGLRIVIFRFSNVYGSERDQLDRVIPKFMLRALRDEDITLYGGDQVLDFTFIDDTISGILLAYDKSFDDGCNIIGKDFHFVTGRGITVSNLAKMVINLCGSSSKIIRKESRGFEVQAFIGNPLKSRRIIGYDPKVRLEKGLEILKEKLLRKML